MKILVAYRSIPEAPGHATGDPLVRAFRRLGHETHPYAKIYRTDSQFFPPAGFEPDLLLRMECGDNESQYPELARLDCPKVYWTFDVARYPAREVAIADQLGADLVLTGNPCHMGTFQQRTEYLPYAVDQDLFHPGAEDRAGAAVIGSLFPERAAFAAEASVELLHGLGHEDYAARLRSLQISVHHHASGGKGLLVMRPWETMGSGTLLLTEEDETHKLHPDIPWLTYRDADQCRSMIADLLANPDRLRKVAEFQHAAVMAAHTYRHRAEAILEMIGSDR